MYKITRILLIFIGISALCLTPFPVPALAGSLNSFDLLGAAAHNIEESVNFYLGVHTNNKKAIKLLLDFPLLRINGNSISYNIKESLASYKKIHERNISALSKLFFDKVALAAPDSSQEIVLENRPGIIQRILVTALRWLERISYNVHDSFARYLDIHNKNKLALAFLANQIAQLEIRDLEDASSNFQSLPVEVINNFPPELTSEDNNLSIELGGINQAINELKLQLQNLQKQYTFDIQGIYGMVALTNRIDNLSNITLVSPIISGSISFPDSIGNLHVGSLTASNFTGVNIDISGSATSSGIIHADILSSQSGLTVGGGSVTLPVNSISDSALSNNVVLSSGFSYLFSQFFSGTTTDALPQGTTNQYYSTSLFAADLAATTTDALAEGAANLFYTNNRFDARLAATTSLPSLTTLANLSAVGTLTSGTWNGSVIAGSYLDRTGDWTGTLDGQEGSYYLDARNLTNFGTPFFQFFSGTTTDALPQGTTNQYYSTSLFAADLAATTTDALAEGAANLFYTNNRFDARLAATTSLPSLTTLANLNTTGSLSSGSIASGFGSINIGNTITGTTINGTTGINTGSGGGTQRIDSLGNLVNIGTADISGLATISGGILVNNATSTITNLNLVNATSTNLFVSNDININSGLSYRINGVSVLSGTTLGSSVVNSSITSVGALSSGSIVSGFGSINIGSNNLTAGNTVINGTLGIGTTSPSAALAVQGNALLSGDLSLANITATGTLVVGDILANRTININGNWGGNVAVSNQLLTANATITVSAKALAYHLTLCNVSTTCSSGNGTQGAAPTATFNITGLPEVDGTFAFIVTNVQRIGVTSNPTESATVIVQINGAQISTVTTGTGNNDSAVIVENYTVVRTSGVWRVIGTPSTSDAADLAEWIEFSGERPEEGDVLSVSNEALKVKISDRSYDEKLVGVVSTYPHTVMGPYTENSVRLALSGRVPVKVSGENGEIKIGDYLTSSSLPGVAMKATQSGFVVGQALTGFNGEGVGYVVVLVKPMYYFGGFNSTLSGGNSLLSLVAEAMKSWIAEMEVIIEKGILKVKSLFAEKISTQDLTAENGVTTKDRATGEYYCIFMEGGVLKSEAGRCEDKTANLAGPITEIPKPKLLDNNPPSEEVIVEEEITAETIMPMEASSEQPINEQDPKETIPPVEEQI
jgi:hypothetical protein